MEAEYLYYKEISQKGKSKIVWVLQQYFTADSYT